MLLGAVSIENSHLYVAVGAGVTQLSDVLNLLNVFQIHDGGGGGRGGGRRAAT